MLPVNNASDEAPVFYDAGKRRWLWVRATLLAIGLPVLAVAVIAGISILFAPLLPKFNLHAPAYVPELEPTFLAGAAHGRLRNQVLLADDKRRLRELRDRVLAKQKQVPATAPLTPLSVVAGYTVNWDESSYASLKLHVKQMTHLFPEWMHLAPGGTGFVTEDGDAQGKNILKLARINRLNILPMINNYQTGWRGDWLHDLLADPSRWQAFDSRLVTYLTATGNHFQGLNLDFEAVKESDRDNLSGFVEALGAALHSRGLMLTQAVPVDDNAFDLPRLAAATDFLVVMAYDQHWSDSDPGPIAGQSWFAEQLHNVASQIPANKLVVATGNYAYDWVKGTHTASSVTYQDAIQTADENESRIHTDPASLNPTYSYEDDNDHGRPHVVWMLDAATSYNQWRATQQVRPLGMALWYVGSEDPSLWTFFNPQMLAHSIAPIALDTITYGRTDVDFEGDGEILQSVTTPQAGHRTLAIDPKSGVIRGERYVDYPSGFVIRRSGKQKKEIALTFDDGPDPRYTPRVLDILKREGVHATFFVIGKNAEGDPADVRREWAEGNEIGNHSWDHPDFAAISKRRANLELSACQRVIESITGHSTLMFRAPYAADSEPQSLAEVIPIVEAQKLGYVVVGETNDPTDWKVDNRPAEQRAAAIIGSVVANRNFGNCVLLHDAGGNRDATIVALPKIIETLKTQGYRFVTVSELMGPHARARLMPPVTGTDRLWVESDSAIFLLTYLAQRMLLAVFLLSIILGVGRVLVMGALALVQRVKERRRVFDHAFKPSVSVVIAAYNEAPVIGRTVTSVLQSFYPGLEVVVVDDGSTDGTADVVEAEFADQPRVRVFRKPNGGKASALNLGMSACKGDVVISFDADTLCAPDAIDKLVRHFADPRVGAVSGNVKVGNRVNVITRWQAIEYVTSQNFDRRAFDLLNCITVVPGAIGAWRRAAVSQAGGYSRETLAEDTDLTFKIRKLGYRIEAENAALAYTEAPCDIRSLARQRFRWAFGTLQCLWKHRRAAFNPRYRAFGLIALPSLWIYQILMQAFAPIVDMSALWALFHANTGVVLGYYGLFFAVELLGALLAFRLDHERPGQLVWLFWQRFVYRQVMWYVIWRSIQAAFAGASVGWGKLSRSGTARATA